MDTLFYVVYMTLKKCKKNIKKTDKKTKQNKTTTTKKHKPFASTIYQNVFSRGVPFLFPPPPLLTGGFQTLSGCITLTSTTFGDMLQTMIILFSTDWTMAGMKTLLIIFVVIMFPVAMITQEDVNHGGNN